MVEGIKIQKINQNYRKHIGLEKNVEARHSLGQANFWSQGKTFWGVNFEAKIEVRPILRPGQANAGFIVCRLMTCFKLCIYIYSRGANGLAFIYFRIFRKVRQIKENISFFCINFQMNVKCTFTECKKKCLCIKKCYLFRVPNNFLDSKCV